MVVHDTYFYNDQGGELHAVPDLSKLVGGTAECEGEIQYDNLYNADKFTGPLNDMSTFDATSGTYLVSLSKIGELVITGPVLGPGPDHELLSEATYWVMPTTNSQDGGFNPDETNFGAAFEYVTDESIYFIGNTGEVYKLSMSALASMVDNDEFGSLPCRNDPAKATAAHESCVNQAFSSIVVPTIEGPVLDTGMDTSNNDGHSPPAPPCTLCCRAPQPLI